jgi:hypothetical protein
MSSGDLKESQATVTSVENEARIEFELGQWSASAAQAEPEPVKFRSRFRLIAVLAGLNVSRN